MILKKPYAFFIKYFRLINFILVLLIIFFLYNLNNLHNTLSNIYLGKFTNYAILESTYLGFKMYFLLILIIFFLVVLLVTLKRKKKPYKEYLYNIIYNIIIFAYFLSVSTLFSSLNEEIVEITSLKVYEDISFLIMVPLIYFIIKYIIIVIGFDLKKFNFAKDIIELKQDEKDSEEIEIVFDKNTYKVKRKIRRYFRELKYYILENKLIIGVISVVVGIVVFISFFSVDIFSSSRVKMNKSFKVGSMSFRVTDVYQTEYDINHNIINKDYKFIVMNVLITNNYFEIQKVDFNRIRLFYGDNFVYANNYYNEHFYDLGIPYNREFLNPNQMYNYSFIFRVPKSYKSNKFTVKFYDGLVTKDEETVGNYKILKFKANILDKEPKMLNQNLKENVVLNRRFYGESNITIKDYILDSSYIYNNGKKDIVVYDKDINKTLLVLDYKLNFDKDLSITNNDKEFFSNFSSISYYVNGNKKIYNNLTVLRIHENKVILSVPSTILDAEKIDFILNFRDIIIVYKLK